MGNNDALAQIAAQLSALAVLVAGHAEKIAVLNDRLAQLEVQAGMDDEYSGVDLSGNPIDVR